MKCSNNQLDSIIVELGEFGKYQKYVALLIVFLTTMNFFSMVIYVFEAMSINHRCQIPQCDNDTTEYNPAWLINAIPFKENKPSRCLRFKHNLNEGCEVGSFNNSVLDTCDTFVYETSETTIMQDFQLHCDENIKTLTMVGTFNGLGKFIGLPIAGYFSDKYGRKTVLVFSMVLSGIFGIIRSFSPSYSFFVVFEFLDSLFGPGAYASAYVLGSEFVGPRKRTLIATMQFLSYGMGSLILGCTAWLLQSWRVLLRVLYVFYLTIISYYWLMPESVRWLLAKNRQEEAVNIIRKISKTNNKELSEGKLENLLNTYNATDTRSVSLRELCKSTTLTIRCVICSFCWMSSIFVHYGLLITSTTLSGHRYLDFVLTASVEIPAYIVAFFLINKIGRKKSFICACLLSTTSSIAYLLLPLDTYWVKLLIYLISKFGTTMTIPSLYMISNEMFPTSLRQTLLSICSMFGRIGNVLVPQLFLLIEIWKNFPLVLFAGLMGISALLALILPETKNIVLPDTIEEAENIGRKQKNSNANN